MLQQCSRVIRGLLLYNMQAHILKTDLRMAVIRSSREVRRCVRTSLRGAELVSGAQGRRSPGKERYMVTYCLFSKSFEDDQRTWVRPGNLREWQSKTKKKAAQQWRGPCYYENASIIVTQRIVTDRQQFVRCFLRTRVRCRIDATPLFTHTASSPTPTPNRQQNIWRPRIYRYVR